MRRTVTIAFLSAAACLCGAAAAKPETVMLRYHAKAGAEEDLARVIARHWKTAHDLKLVTDTPHVTVRGTEEGKTYFVDIFTWRDGSTPDRAPAAIQAIWAEMNQLVEARGGRQGIEMTEVTVEQ